MSVMAGLKVPLILWASSNTGCRLFTEIRIVLFKNMLLAQRALRYWTGFWFFSAYPRNKPELNFECLVASVNKKLSLCLSLVSHRIFSPIVDSVSVVCLPSSSVVLKWNLTCFFVVTSKIGSVLFSKSNSLIPSAVALISESDIAEKYVKMCRRNIFV